MKPLVLLLALNCASCTAMSEWLAEPAVEGAATTNGDAVVQGAGDVATLVTGNPAIGAGVAAAASLIVAALLKRKKVA